MASQSYLRIGDHIYGGSEKYINDPQARLFNSTDLIAEEIRADGELGWSYRITVGELRRRLETLGYSLEQVREDVVTTLARGYKDLEEYDTIYYRHFLDYGTNISVNELTEIVGKSLRKDLKSSDFNYVNTDDFPRAMLDFISGDHTFLVPNERIFLSGFHFERLACEQYRDDDVYELDFSKLVLAGYYLPYEQPLPDNYNEALSKITPNSYRLGQTLFEEESETLEFKTITAANPCKAIASQITPYAIGFLNRKGGRILFGVSDQGKVEGVCINRADRDELQRLINAACVAIQPSFSIGSSLIQLRPLIDIGREMTERFVIEVVVPAGKSNEMYFKPNGDTWVRVGTETRAMRGHELFVHICAHYSSADDLLTAVSQRAHVAIEEVRRLKQDGEKYEGELTRKQQELAGLQHEIAEAMKVLRGTDLICPSCESKLKQAHTFTTTFIDSEGRDFDADFEELEYECGYRIRTDQLQPLAPCMTVKGDEP